MGTKPRRGQQVWNVGSFFFIELYSVTLKRKKKEFLGQHIKNNAIEINNFWYMKII